MIGICKQCGKCEDMTLEEAKSPGCLCSECFKKYESDACGNIKRRK